MCLMGVGTNILGYGNQEVDKKVLETVKKGNMSTFNCPEEVALARATSSGQLKVDILPFFTVSNTFLSTS